MSALTDISDLLFIRHGETDWNVLGRLQGQSNESRLTEIGKNQAAEVAKNLLKSLQDKKFEIWSSDLSRAQETAKIIANLLGYKDPIKLDPRLREADHGKFEGLLPRDYKNDPDYQVRINYTPEQKFTLAMDPLKGESGQKVALRVRAVLQEISSQNPETIKIIVTHGGVINSLRKLVTQQFDLPDAKNGEIFTLPTLHFIHKS